MAKKYRGIVVVHGIGEHTKGSYISGFVEELVNFLSKPEALGTKNVQVSVRSRGDTSDTAWATLHITNPDPGKEDEEWHIREAWWSRTFEPSAPGRVYLWAILAGLASLWASLKHQLGRAVLTAFAPARLARWHSEIVGRPFDRASHVALDPPAHGIWRQPHSGRLKAVLDGVVWLVVTTVWLALAFTAMVVIGVFYLLLVLPLSFVFPSAARSILTVLVNIIVRNLGDQEAMTTRRFALASATNEVTTALWNMLSPDGLRSRRRDDKEFSGFDTVTVVAHSGGSVVSLAALKSVDLARFWSQPLEPGLRRPERLTWVTAGNGLNLAWNVRFGGTPTDAALWDGPLEKINWVNIYARYDPIPQGPPRAGMVAALVGADPETLTPPGNGARPAYVGLRVVNEDNPWADHTSYWKNGPEVLARVVHVVTRDDLATTPLSPEVTTVEAKNLAALNDVLADPFSERAVTKRRGEKSLAMFLGVVAALVLIPFTVIWADDVGRWGLGTDGVAGMAPWAPGGHQLENVVTKQLARVNVEEYRDRIFGLAIIGFALLITVEYARLAYWLLRYGAVRQRGGIGWLWLGGGIVILLSTLALLDLLLIRWPTGQLG